MQNKINRYKICGSILFLLSLLSIVGLFVMFLIDNMNMAAVLSLLTISLSYASMLCDEMIIKIYECTKQRDLIIRGDNNEIYICREEQPTDNEKSEL